jgi:hypothetical protein
MIGGKLHSWSKSDSDSDSDLVIIGDEWNVEEVVMERVDELKTHKEA